MRIAKAELMYSHIEEARVTADPGDLETKNEEGKVNNRPMEETSDEF